MKWAAVFIPVGFLIALAGMRITFMKGVREGFVLDPFGAAWLSVVLFLILQPLWAPITSVPTFTREWFFFASLWGVYIITRNGTFGKGLPILLWLAALTGALNVLFAELQIHDLHHLFPFVYPTPGKYIGNTGQQNMFGLWVAIAMMGSSWLFFQDRPADDISGRKNIAAAANLFLFAVNAWGIDVQNRCCTCVSAMKIAKDMLLADDEINTVLVVGGYRNGDFLDYTDRNMSMMYNLGAGGGAILLRKNHGENLLLGSHILSDGSLARTAGVEIGGHTKPITCENLEEAKRSLRLFEPEKMKARLNEVSAQNWVTCIEKSLKKSGLALSDLDYLAILHIKRSGHLGMLKDLGLTEEQTIYLEDYGHIGQIDQILSLHLALEQGKVKDGSVICMLAAGIGYVWAANIIKWGPKDA